MNDLFDHWENVCSRFRSARKIGLFLDLDGALVEAECDPQEERALDEPVRKTLSALADSPRVKVTIVSERTPEDIAAEVQIPSLQYIDLRKRTSGSPGLPE